jgi:hypothetical protein
MIIDVHTHITYEKYPEFCQFRLKDREPFTVQTLLKEMDTDGIEISVLLPLTNPENDAYLGVAGNFESIEAANKYPDRLIPFCNIDPRSMFNSPEADLGKLIRAYKNLGCKGIGEICANISLASPLYKNLFYHAEKETMPMLFHFTGQMGGVYGAVDEMHFPALQKLLNEFPKVKVLGHAMAFWNEIDGNLKPEDREEYLTGTIKKDGHLFTLLERYPNLYGDISAYSAYKALSRDYEVGCRFLKRFNEKLFFGTDRFTPQHGVCPPILKFMKEALRNKKISLSEYENIMYKNFNRLISKT